MKSIICFLARSLGLCVIALATTAQTVNPIFVLNSRDANVSVIDPLTWSMTQKIATGKEPHHLYLTPDEKSVIVANAASDSLTFIDPKTAQVQKVIKGTLINCVFHPT